jgi:hypothetical protein
MSKEKPLSEIARQAWLECPLDGDYWEAAASAVRKAVLEEAIKEATTRRDHFAELEKRTDDLEDANYYAANKAGALDVIAALTRLMGDE